VKQLSGFIIALTMSDETELPEENNNAEVLQAFNLVIQNFMPCDEISDDSFTTEELRELVADHVGLAFSAQIYKLMIEAGFASKFSYARKELVWMMELR
jgi:hypothetical protein